MYMNESNFMEKLNKTDDLIISVLSDNASTKECRMLNDWLEASHENKQYFKAMRNTWLASGVIRKMNGSDANHGFRKFTSTIPPSPAHKDNKKQRILQMVAISIVLLAVGTISYYFFKPNETPLISSSYYETIVPIGAKSQIVLVDGTKVWLNAESRLRYSKTFALSDREVFLEGEGYFEVTPNKDLPFEVKTSKLKVKAIGTSFNVKAYPNDSIIEAILVSGKIEVSQTENEDSDETAVLLLPKQRITYLKNTNEILFESKPKYEIEEKHTETVILEPIKPVISQKIKEIPATTDYMVSTSWKDKRWSIESEELKSLAIKLERRYNVHISFVNEDLKDYKFTGTIEDEPIEAVLKVISQTSPVNYEIRGSEITLLLNDKFRELHKELWQVK